MGKPPRKFSSGVFGFAAKVILRNYLLCKQEGVNVGSNVQLAVVSIKYDCYNLVTIIVQLDISIRYQVGSARDNNLVSLGYSILGAFQTLSLIIINCDVLAILIQIHGLSMTSIITVGDNIIVNTGDKYHAGGTSSIGIDLTNNTYVINVLTVFGVLNYVACLCAGGVVGSINIQSYVLRTSPYIISSLLLTVNVSLTRRFNYRLL